MSEFEQMYREVILDHYKTPRNHGILDPNDAAVSKYARGEAKDHAWIREGLKQSILSLATIEYRFRETPFLDREEHTRAKTALENDRQWLTSPHKN